MDDDQMVLRVRRPVGDAPAQTGERAHTRRRRFGWSYVPRGGAMEQAAVSALASPPPHGLRWWRVTFTMLGLLCFASFVVAILIGMQAGLYGWQSGDWNRLTSAALLLPILGYLALYTLVAWLYQPTRVWKYAQPLRAALDAHVAEIGPVVPALDPLPPEQLHDTSINFRSLRPFTGLSIFANTISYLLAGFAYPLLMGGLSLHNALNPSSDIFPWLVLPFALGLCIFAILIIWYIYLSIEPRWRLRITTDSEGLAWTWGRRGIQHRASWQSVRAIYRFVRGDDLIFALYFNDDGLLAWRMKQAGNGELAQNECERLLQIVIARTGQPLRDGMLPFAWATYTRHRSNELRESNVPHFLLPSLLTYFKLRDAQRIVVTGMVFMLVIIILTIPLSQLGAVRLQDMQVDYFKSLPQKVQAAPVLYRNNLAANDGLWPLTAAGLPATQPQFMFTGGAYQMSGRQGQPVVALIPRSYTDAAIEVTVRQSNRALGTTAQRAGYWYGSDWGAGLAFHAVNSSDMIVFTVDAQDGNWSATVYSGTEPRYTAGDIYVVYKNYIPFSQNDVLPSNEPIHQGPNSTNTLLVILRAPIYLFYINGQYVGQATDSNDIYSQKPPTTGQVGLFLADGGTPTSFSDFRVYAVQPSSSLNYV